MQITKGNFRKSAALIFIVFMLTLAAAAQQKPSEITVVRQMDLGRGMGLINAGLMDIASESDLFLSLADKIGLSSEQVKKLEGLYAELQKYTIRKQADIDVTEAEFRRLLSKDIVDLAAVRLKIKEMEAQQSEFTMKKVETILQAVNALTQDQRSKVILVVSEMTEEKSPLPPQN